MKQKVVTKKEIEQTLLAGGFIRWIQWDAKAELLDNTREVVGTIRFDTYIKLDLREINMKMPLFDTEGNANDEASPFYRLKRWDPWCGYDLFQLRVPEEQLTSCQKYYLKRMWR